ncbi:MAG: hypothetical protein U0992_21575 [Planctomycetaceae bacterium]
MALTHQLALVPDGVDIPASQLTRVAAALSKQVERDFAPIWNVEATVDAFDRLEDVPSDYWPIIVTRVPDGGVITKTRTASRSRWWISLISGR